MADVQRELKQKVRLNEYFAFSRFWQSAVPPLADPATHSSHGVWSSRRSLDRGTANH